ncbi:molecular chaperone DnaJ [Aquihabitans sp. G128]|uniref:molecular chaperone DnaJ n=1 Tax=Aquihabitans sp. G128 TaxID=2849779 RepID=UPI001C2323EA|nr:molecular chaperone DnaJ [Aquihabitans sp. G128]QXC59930.1 molecular chaperone DnaJ [Aquihabitans sp. G128]
MAAQREWFEKDYYRVLGVAEDADAKDITRAYRKLARENHPDANPGDSAAEERFKEISAAYDVVGDAEKRKEYDEVRAAGPMGPGGPGGFGGGGPSGGFTFNAGDMGGGLGDVFGNLFGGGRGRGGRGRATGPQRGGDLEAELHLGFTDAVAGLTTTLHLVSDAVCHVCNGNGAEPGTTPTTCPTCGGRGVVDDDQGFFATQRPCPQCAGRGVLIEHPCKNCRGVGIERRPREVKVRIPAGVHDGQRIRLKGRGDPGRNGGPPGDLFVTCKVDPHALFRMDGRDLRITVPITFPEAALGADISVPTIDGASVKVRLPAGTRTGRTFRVKGRGVATTKATGDLLVTVEVAVPVTLSDAERAAVEALAAAADESPRAHLFPPAAPEPETEEASR